MIFVFIYKKNYNKNLKEKQVLDYIQNLKMGNFNKGNC